MAMTAQGMADAIYAELESAYQGISGGEAEIKQYLGVLSAGIIKYLKSNMDVVPGTFANSGGERNRHGEGGVRKWLSDHGAI
ncbi:MAG: hypothetical protein Pg6C_18560 [Treponemataceae bacterium]|nr:MAG: hypothetical protein Pg6C_18560 [Treponemataceae bacterium]